MVSVSPARSSAEKSSARVSSPAREGRPSLELSTFFDVSLDLLCIRDLEGTVVKVSQSWETTLGYSPKEIEGGVLLRFVHPDDLAGTHDSIVEVETRRAGAPVLGHLNRYRHKDGTYRTLEWRAQRFGERIYAVARDVTERVAAEAALVEAKAAAEAASRAKSDFLANMSHEIRTPLNGVIGIVDALSRTGLSAEQTEMVAMIRESGVMLERLVSDVLDVSKIEAGQFDIESRPFDLDEAILSCLDVARSRADERHLGFRVERTDTARGVFIGDSTRIRQVLGNLLSNAVKFTTHGHVAVYIHVAGKTAGEALLTLEVEDTGVGFDAGQATRLFDRFSQADATITRRFGGTGLGLSICRSLVDMMGGKIAARSEPGAGSRFTVTLPLSRVESVADYDVRTGIVASRPALANLRQDRLRVLLAEDHPTNQRVVQLILGSQGAEVVTCNDGAEALAAFESGVFDVVLMDMQMPVMDGLSATRAIRASEAGRPERVRTPVIMLTANAMAEHRAYAREAGADLHVAKPITAVSLLEGIHAVMGNSDRPNVLDREKDWTLVC
ncbi:MAG: hybrid sensor histidine kinase/response regulator [Alphaproteobacteria bacterium]|nr:MAG: hybrid sensor histidine kinase/response regulator [Alphaproteobacteria bacterium]PZO38930.1 MAG: hybrid sensor histidine kinase/response regulator [Alphaproteobacteria bacterium]